MNLPEKLSEHGLGREYAHRINKLIDWCKAHRPVDSSTVVHDRSVNGITPRAAGIAVANKSQEDPVWG